MYQNKEEREKTQRTNPNVKEHIKKITAFAHEAVIKIVNARKAAFLNLLTMYHIVDSNAVQLPFAAQVNSTNPVMSSIIP